MSRRRHLFKCQMVRMDTIKTKMEKILPEITKRRMTKMEKAAAVKKTRGAKSEEADLEGKKAGKEVKIKIKEARIDIGIAVIK